MYVYSVDFGVRKGNFNLETYPSVVVARKQRYKCKKIVMCVAIFCSTQESRCVCYLRNFTVLIIRI